jgi:hypothetical protein
MYAQPTLRELPVDIVQWRTSTTMALAEVKKPEAIWPADQAKRAGGQDRPQPV